MQLVVIYPAGVDLVALAVLEQPRGGLPHPEAVSSLMGGAVACSRGVGQAA